MHKIKQKQALTPCIKVPFQKLHFVSCRSQWPRGLRRGSAAERLLGSWVRIPSGTRMFVSCECLCCQVVLCDGPIPHPEESYRLWCVFQYDQVKNKQPRHLLWVGRRHKDYEFSQVLKELAPLHG
jgi:hypothetical protein